MSDKYKISRKMLYFSSIFFIPQLVVVAIQDLTKEFHIIFLLTASFFILSALYAIGLITFYAINKKDKVN